MSKKKIEKIGGPWGGLLIRKINEIIDVLNGEDEVGEEENLEDRIKNAKPHGVIPVTEEELKEISRTHRIEDLSIGEKHIGIELTRKEVELLRGFMENQVVQLEETLQIRKVKTIEKDCETLRTILIKLCNYSDEQGCRKPEGFQGPRGEPGVPGAGEWGKSKEWKKLCSLIGYHPQDERLTLIIKLIESEKKKSRAEALGEVKKKFGGGVVVGINDNDLGVKVDIRSPELDVYLEEELDKLERGKDNGRIRTNGEDVS